ncbi:TetR/AcrR family transcriptional regulator [Uliginosibacterium sp. H1]|uniref:TetR/AcrR family transcriptional regulator n=1 Tax=Uliginosibacterium sp. H1 TaxID=3114757 RepID=UPI002E19CC6F|nr:TetR/AcrR family transcriptional regulator [Uliginosibacterium sp. H1]
MPPEPLPNPDEPRRRRKEARPGELVAAALDVFVERGFAAARLDEIAARAGVSKGTLYLYFESKEALFKAVVQEAIVPRIAEGEAMVASLDMAPEPLLRELLLGWWEVVANSKLSGIPKLVIGEAANFPEVAQFYFDNVVQRGRALLVSVIERGIAEGAFRPGDPLVICQLALSPMLFASMWSRSLACCDPAGMSPDVYLRTHLDLFLTGLRAEAGRASLPVV